MNKLLLSSIVVAAATGFAQADVFSNPAAITIPNSGNATPYPSTITVPGSFVGSIASVTVTLTGFSHTFPGDCDILLVGPTGASCVLLSDAGGDDDVTNINLTFATGGNLVPTPLVTGTYTPTDLFPSAEWGAPAPIGPYGSALTSFNGTSAVGVWSLYIVDDAGGDLGTIAGGWSLNITVPTPGAAALLGLGGLIVGRRRR